MEDEQPKLTCPFCGSQTDSVNRDLTRHIRAFALLDFFSVFLHDVKNLLSDLVDTYSIIKDTMSGTRQTRRTRENLTRMLELGETKINILSTMTHTFHSAYGRFDMVTPVSELPERIKEICTFSGIRTGFDFAPLLDAESALVNEDAYMTAFDVCLSECLIALSLDRRPDIRIEFHVSRKCITTTFFLTHHARLHTRDNGDWNWLRWCLRLANGSRLRKHKTSNETYLSWEIPLTSRDKA